MRKTNITFRKSFRILSLIRVNFGKPGFTSVSIGGRKTLNMEAYAQERSTKELLEVESNS
ncbi:TPA: DUF4236 domain-containing protein [Vibrio alginolyticus]|nr:DUF4236 domain-containing protein [Vibrio alginolyticus]